MTERFPTGRASVDFFVRFTSTLSFAGYFPFAPGTAGTLVAAALFWVLRDLTPLHHAALALGILALGTWVAGRAEVVFGEKDSGKIVIDEMAGFWVTMLFHPASLGWIVSGFCLFRLFDVTKPFPVNYAEQRFRGGLGVMLDDVVAGIYANAALHLLGWFTR